MSITLDYQYPVLGCGKIKNRDNHSMWNTDQEHKLRVPEDAFWKKYAAECSRVQIAVDVFSFWSVHLAPQLIKFAGIELH